MKKSKKVLKSYFETGDKPTQQQFEDLIDSLAHEDQVNGNKPQADWNQTDTTKEDFIKNKPSIPSAIPNYEFSIEANKFKIKNNGIQIADLDLSLYLDDTNLARLVSGTYDAATKKATFTRDDKTTFDLDLSTLELGLSFADEKGNVKYSNTIDKRQGYYDVATKTYYPSILELQVSKKYSIVPCDGHGYLNGTSNYFWYKLPNKVGVISFDVCFYGRESVAYKEEYFKANIKAELNGGWTNYNNPTITLLTSSTKNQYDFEFVNSNKELYVLVKPRLNTITLFEGKVENVFVYNRFPGFTNPVDWQKGWEFSIKNLAQVDVEYSITYEKALPVAKPQKNIPEYTLSSISGVNQIGLYKDGNQVSTVDLSAYVDDTNLARLVNGSLDAKTGVLTVTRDDDSSFNIDISPLLIQTQPNWHQKNPSGADYIKNKLKIINITFSELRSLAGSSNLIPSQQYKITDYKTIYTQLGTNIKSDSPEGISSGLDTNVEPIIVKALDISRLEKLARSTIYVKDEITFDISKGIVYRKDTALRIESNFDWRAEKFRLYRITVPLSVNGASVEIGEILKRNDSGTIKYYIAITSFSNLDVSADFDNVEKLIEISLFDTIGYTENDHIVGRHFNHRNIKINPASFQDVYAFGNSKQPSRGQAYNSKIERGIVVRTCLDSNIVSNSSLQRLDSMGGSISFDYEFNPYTIYLDDVRHSTISINKYSIVKRVIRCKKIFTSVITSGVISDEYTDMSYDLHGVHSLERDFNSRMSVINLFCKNAFIDKNSKVVGLIVTHSQGNDSVAIFNSSISQSICINGTLNFSNGTLLDVRMFNTKFYKVDLNNNFLSKCKFIAKATDIVSGNALKYFNHLDIYTSFRDSIFSKKIEDGNQTNISWSSINLGKELSNVTLRLNRISDKKIDGHVGNGKGNEISIFSYSIDKQGNKTPQLLN